MIGLGVIICSLFFTACSNDDDNKGVEGHSSKSFKHVVKVVAAEEGYSEESTIPYDAQGRIILLLTV